MCVWGGGGGGRRDDLHLSLSAVSHDVLALEKVCVWGWGGGGGYNLQLSLSAVSHHDISSSNKAVYFVRPLIGKWYTLTKAAFRLSIYILTSDQDGTYVLWKAHKSFIPCLS